MPDPLESFLYSNDVAILRWINVSWSCTFLDVFFRFITNYHHFVILILLLLLGLLIWGGKKGRWVVLALIITVTLTDQVSAHVFKDIFDRVRPCNALPGILTPDDKPTSFSFPSSHATNMGGSMTLLALAYPAWGWICALVAFLVGLSRVYLGVHYPSDVLGGWLLGIAIGWGMWTITKPFTVEKAKPILAAAKVSKKRTKPRKGGTRGRRK